MQEQPHRSSVQSSASASTSSVAQPEPGPQPACRYSPSRPLPAGSRVREDGGVLGEERVIPVCSPKPLTYKGLLLCHGVSSLALFFMLSYFRISSNCEGRARRETLAQRMGGAGKHIITTTHRMPLLCTFLHLSTGSDTGIF